MVTRYKIVTKSIPDIKLSQESSNIILANIIANERELENWYWLVCPTHPYQHWPVLHCTMIPLSTRMLR